MTKIEWTERTWNPIVGCSIVSPGCTNCYAMRMAARLEAMSHAHEARTGGDPGPLFHYRDLTQDSRAGPVWTGNVRLAPEDVLTKPLHWRKPRMIFVNSMSDLFHEDVPDEWIDRVFAVMALTPQHTFQVLTKRSARMRSYLTQLHDESASDTARRFGQALYELRAVPENDVTIPLPNVWLGVSCERQQEAVERIPDLLQTPAAIRFVSAEPLLGPIDFARLGDATFRLNAFTGEAEHTLGFKDRTRGRLDWIIVGGESGPDARRLWTDNVRSIVRQCQEAGVPVYVKQLGTNVQDRNDAGFDGDHDSWPWEHDCEGRIEENLSGYYDGYQGAPVRIHLKSRKGANPEEWPPALRVREYPKARCSEAEDANA